MNKDVLNIISKSYKSPQGGPGKVVLNTIKGLERLNHNYTINQSIQKYQYNWIHDDHNAFIEAVLCKIPCIVGPNLFLMPSDLPWFLGKMDHIIYLHPSKWTVDAWKEVGFNSCPLIPWPAGIDWESFSTHRSNKSTNILLYLKKRPEEEKKLVRQILQGLGYHIIELEYGNYKENQFKEALKNSTTGIWVGTTESQGIALEEALASDLPLIVVNKKNILDNISVNPKFASKGSEKVVASTVPYFDDSCGLIINDIKEIPDAITTLLKNLKDYKPKEYIKTNLSLEKQAGDLLNLFKDIENKTRGKNCYLKFFTVKKIHYLRSIATRMRKLLYRKTGI